MKLTPTVHCNSCKAEIAWVRTKAGKLMPVDANPSPVGNLRVVDGQANYLGPKEKEDAEGPLYLSHFATCPNGPQHRKGA